LPEALVIYMPQALTKEAEGPDPYLSGYPVRPGCFARPYTPDDPDDLVPSYLRILAYLVGPI